MLALLISSLVIPGQNVFAEGGDYSSLGDMQPFVQPNELLNNMPQFGADPFNIPNPASGIVPGSPQGIGASFDTQPQAPGALKMPEPPPFTDPMKQPVALATGAVRFDYIDLSTAQRKFVTR